VSKLFSIFKALGRGEVWSFAVFSQASAFSLQALPSPVKIFNSKAFRTSRQAPYTQADPFVFARNGQLFIFYEVVVPGGKGEIACCKTDDLRSFEQLGVVLKERHHLSFPFVFEDDGRTYMVPESSAAREVALYEFTAFPNELHKRRTLLQGEYADSILVKHGGTWYLFTTLADGALQIHCAESLLEGDFQPHPANPITKDRRYSRLGGSILNVEGKLIRISQDCAHNYGDNINFHEILTLSPTDYEEALVHAQFFDKQDAWNQRGAHHLSTCEFQGQHIIVADGKHLDYWMNRLLLRLV
jgi:hypothetical protein